MRYTIFQLIPWQLRFLVSLLFDFATCMHATFNNQFYMLHGKCKFNKKIFFFVSNKVSVVYYLRHFLRDQTFFVSPQFFFVVMFSFAQYYDPKNFAYKICKYLRKNFFLYFYYYFNHPSIFIYIHSFVRR